MIKKLVKLLSAFLVLMCSIIPVYAIDIPPSTDEYYLDEANVLSQSTKNYLSDKNYELDRHCGAYVEVVTEKYINCDVADYAYKIQNDWEITDNGFTLVLVTEEGKYYLTWGRDIERNFESYVFDEILETYFEPDFDAGNYDAAVRKTYDAIYKELVGVYGSPTKQSDTQTTHSDSSVYAIISIVVIFVMAITIILVVFVIISVRRRNRRMYYGRYTTPPPFRPHTGGFFHSSGHHYSSGHTSSGFGHSSSSHHSSFGGGHSSSSHHSSSGRSSGGRSHGGGGRGAGSGRR